MDRKDERKAILGWLLLAIVEVLTTGIIVYNVFSRQVMLITSIGHTIDFPAGGDQILVYFFWGAWSLPAAWALGVLFTLTRLIRHKSPLGFSVVAPALVGILYWCAWTYAIHY